MAVKNFKTGPTSITAKAAFKTHIDPQVNVELENFVPLRMAVWNTDEYRIANGWPVVPPEYDVQARSLVSAEGYTLAYREQPRAITTGASARWIAGDEFYDLTSLKWHSYESEFPLFWTTSPEYAPTYVDDYDYRYQSDVFIQETMNFDSDSSEHMWINLENSLGGAAGYTVIMAVSLNSVYGGSNEEAQRVGIWCPGYPTPAPGEPLSEAPKGGWVSLTLKGTSLYLETDQSSPVRALAISDLLATSAPILIAMVVNRPYTSIYAGRGPSSLIMTKIDVGDVDVALDGHVVLGRTNGRTDMSADMSVMEVNLYNEELSPEEVRNEIALLSSVYGGDR